MKVKCKKTELTEEQKNLFKVPPRFNPGHRVSVGREYLVIGISFVVGSPYYGDSALFEIVNDQGHLVSQPAALFEVTDARCSSFWRTEIHEDGAVTLWPHELYEQYFHDRLSDGEPEARNTFQVVRSKLQAEFESTETMLRSRESHNA
jgi:hypothetical protein